LIRIHRIDIVISDNRFGLWNKRIKHLCNASALYSLPGRLVARMDWHFAHRYIIRNILRFIPDLAVK
jgi:hypothetical protein